MTRGGNFVAALLSASGCVPTLTEFVASAPWRPGSDLVVRGTLTLGDASDARQTSGRAHVALLLPDGWDVVSGDYATAGTSGALRRWPLWKAPAVAEGYERAVPKSGHRWVGLVTFLHTGLEGPSRFTGTVTLRPPAAAGTAPVEVSVGIGPAPTYSGWSRRLAVERTLRIEPAGRE